jgi:hypothetical protein
MGVFGWQIEQIRSKEENLSAVSLINRLLRNISSLILSLVSTSFVRLKGIQYIWVLFCCYYI